MTRLWIEYTDEGDGDGAARWATVTNEQIDQILEHASKILGEPDTVA